MKAQYREQGIVVVPGLFQPDHIQAALQDVENLFLTQLRMLGLIEAGAPPLNEADFHSLLKVLHNEHPENYLSALNQCPRLPSLAKLGTQPSVLKVLSQLGISSPLMATPPICYFLSEGLSLPGGHHRAPPHQDWRYIQGSLDALTLWLPLVDLTEDMGAVQFIYGSHRRGLLPTKSEDRDLSIPAKHFDANQFRDCPAQAGDALFFSGFVIHQSGVNTSGKMRWALAFRYNNLDEPSFVKRGMPSPYRFTPSLQLQHKNWPTPKHMAQIFSPPLEPTD